MAIGSISAPQKDELAQWCRAFGRSLDGAWEPRVAATLFEQIEQLSTPGVDGSADDLMEAAAELTVYLCSFAEGDVMPDADQRAHLRELNRRLADLAGRGTPALTRVVPDTPGKPALLRVFHVRLAGRENPELAAALGLLRFSVVPFASSESARAALVRERPDAVIVDGALLGELPTLVDGARRHVSDNWRRVLWAAIGVDDDLRLRLFARRAGIDLLLDAAAPERAAAALLATLIRRREERFRVLLVEDDRSQATFATSLLRHQGLLVEHAENAAEALTLLGARAPDLVLLDIHLPDMSGIELAQLIRERDSLAHVPLVFLTGEQDEDVRVEAIAAGADDFLTKPIRPRHLIANVNSRIGRARALAIGALAEPIDESLSPRLDRVRFVEALERRRRESERCLAVAALAMDSMAAVTARLGFVRSGDLAVQIALAIESESPGGGPTCGVGEFSRLVLLEAESEHGLKRALDALRKRLEGRKWLSALYPLQIGFSAAAVRYDGAALEPDAIIAEALDELSRLRSTTAGGGTSLKRIGVEDDADVDPTRRISRVMLSQPLRAEAGRLQFRPMLPLRGAEHGGFLCRTLLIPPQAGTGLLIAPEVHAPVAASMGAQSVVDRLSFELVARYARSALVAANGWRVLLPVASVTLQEPLVAEWLQRSGVDPGQLVLAVESRDLSAGSSLAASLQRLAGRGWHWALRADAPEAIEKGALELPNLDVLLLGNLLADPRAWDPVLKLARDYGKTVVATGVDEARQVAPLFAAGVHYALGDAAGGWEEEPRFEMTHVR